MFGHFYVNILQSCEDLKYFKTQKHETVVANLIGNLKKKYASVMKKSQTSITIYRNKNKRELIYNALVMKIEANQTFV